MYRFSARVTCLLTVDRERVAEVHVPPVEMAFVAIRLPQHLEVSQHDNKCQRDGKRRAFHSVPPRTYPRAAPPRRHGTPRNDAAVCIGADDGGAATAAAGVDGRRRRCHGSLDLDGI